MSKENRYRTKVLNKATYGDPDHVLFWGSAQFGNLKGSPPSPGVRLARWMERHHKAFVYQDEYRTSLVRTSSESFRVTLTKVPFESPDCFLRDVETSRPAKQNQGKKRKIEEEKKKKIKEKRRKKKRKWERRKKRMRQRTRRKAEAELTETATPTPVTRVDKKSEKSTLPPGAEEKEQKPQTKRLVFALKACTEEHALQRLNRPCAPIVLNRDHNAAKNILHCGLRTLRQLPPLPIFRRAQQIEPADTGKDMTTAI